MIPIMTVIRVLTALTLLATLAACGAGQPGQQPASPKASKPGTSSSSATTSGSKQDAFLAALRTAGVPISVSGESEQLIGIGVCKQLAAGKHTAESLASDLTAAGYTKNQATVVVEAARKHLC
jgi:predicted small lipoprotein YifL